MTLSSPILRPAARFAQYPRPILLEMHRLPIHSVAKPKSTSQSRSEACPLELLQIVDPFPIARALEPTSLPFGTRF